jgi:hypothetical protein
VNRNDGILRAQRRLRAAVITVRGVRRAAFVEFEYSLADGELAVELIMPLHALREFRSARRAQFRHPRRRACL